MSRIIKIIVFILVGLCLLGLILAFNAGQKRKNAISRLDDLNAKLAEINLRYKNAIQSYDDVEKSLEETKKNLKEQEVFSETLKETLLVEQKKSQALEEALNKAKTFMALTPDKDNKASPKQRAATKVAPQTQIKKIDRTTRNW